MLSPSLVHVQYLDSKGLPINAYVRTIDLSSSLGAHYEVHNNAFLCSLVVNIEV